MFGRHVLYVILIGIFWGAFPRAEGLKVGFSLFPDSDRLKLAAGIVEELQFRGHEVAIYVPEYFAYLCQKEFGTRCISLGVYNASTTEGNKLVGTFFDMKQLLFNASENARINAFFASALRATMQKLPSLPDVMIVDIEMWSVDSVARTLFIPTVLFWSPTNWPIQMNPSFPAFGSGLSVKMNLIERAKNYFFQRRNYWSTFFEYTKLDHSYESFQDLLYRRQIIAPFVFGLDVAQPLCPNVHVVGFLFSRATDLEVINVKWASWMNGCTKGLLYINLGPVSHFSKEWVHNLYESLETFTNQTKMCVLWELREDGHLFSASKKDKENIWIVSLLPFSRRMVLRHENTKVFLTHCGGRFVYESIEGGVPLLGLCYLPDQQDMCARIQDADIGMILNMRELNSSQLSKAVLHVKENYDMKKKLEKIKRMGHIMGGSRKAASVVELAASLGQGNEDLFCPFVQLQFIQRHDLDIVFIFSGLIVACALIIMKIARCNKFAKQTHVKQE